MSVNLNVLAFQRAKNLFYGMEYNELYDALFNYMLTYLNGPEIDNYLLLDEVENYIGHKAGGVCPFGIKEDVIVYLDASLKQYQIVYPACGSHNSAVKLSLDELEKASNYCKWVDVCKN